MKDEEMRRLRQKEISEHSKKFLGAFNVGKFSRWLGTSSEVLDRRGVLMISDSFIGSVVGATGISSGEPVVLESDPQQRLKQMLFMIYPLSGKINDYYVFRRQILTGDPELQRYKFRYNYD